MGGFLLKYFGGAFEVGLLSWFSRLCLGGGELERWPSARDQAPGGLDPTALLPSSCSDGGVVLLPSNRCGMAFAQGRLELARVCLASPRPCRSCARTSQGRQAEGPEIPVDLSCSTQDPRKGLALGCPTGTEGGDPPSSPHSCPIPQDPPPADLAQVPQPPASSHHSAHRFTPARSCLKDAELLPPHHLGGCLSLFSECPSVCSSMAPSGLLPRSPLNCRLLKKAFLMTSSKGGTL